MTCAFNDDILLPGKRLMGYLSQEYKYFSYIPKEWHCTKLAAEVFLNRGLFLAETLGKFLLSLSFLNSKMRTLIPAT